MVLLAIPTVAVLLMCIGVGGCEWPSSSRVGHRILASWALRKRAPSLALAADATTSFRMVQVIQIATFSLIGSPLTGMLLRKKYPPAQLRARGTDKYDALECTLSIMSDARYRILASGCVHM
jgi:hypothetical protein